MKFTLEEIENFVSATLTIISKDEDNAFPMSDEYVADLVFGDLDEEDEDEDGVSFTEDEEEAIEIMKSLISNLDADSLEMYEDCPYNEDEEDNEVDIKMLGNTLRKIKEMNNLDEEDEYDDEEGDDEEEIKPKSKKEKAKKTEKEKKEKRPKIIEEPEEILMTMDQLTEFFIEIQKLVEDNFIMIEDESIVQKIPSAKTINSFFEYLNDELMPEDLENITEKSQELLEKVKDKVIVLEEKHKKAEKAEKDDKTPRRGRPSKKDKEDAQDEDIKEVKKTKEVKEVKEVKEEKTRSSDVSTPDGVDFISMFDEIIQVIKKYRNA